MPRCWISRCVLVAALCAGCGADLGGGAASPGSDPLDANWLGYGSTIGEDELGRVFAIGERDPAVRALFAEAQARLGGGQLSGLARRFSLCPSSMMGEGGLTLITSFDVWIPRQLEDLAFRTTHPQTAQTIADVTKGPALESNTVQKTDFILVQRTPMPQICIVPRLSLAEAYEAVVHELVHALRYRPRNRWELARTPVDAASFRQTLVTGPGGELEAYTFSAGARIRLRHGRLLASPLLVGFDPATGVPRISPPELAAIILAPQPGGLGYADGLLREALTQARREILDELVARRQLVETMIGERRTAAEIFEKNIGVYQHNIEANRHNHSIAKARGDKALIQRSSAGIAEAEGGLVRTRALLDAAHASEARLVEELAAVSAELEAIQALVSGGSAP